MNYLKSIVLFVCCFFLAKNSSAQTSSTKYTNPYTNPVILSHYSIQDLQQIENQDSIKFNSIVYYYTQSYLIEPIICDECPVVDINTVDVSQYEYLRKKTERHTRDLYKYGFKITLLSVDELKYKLPIHNQ